MAHDVAQHAWLSVQLIRLTSVSAGKDMGPTCRHYGPDHPDRAS